MIVSGVLRHFQPLVVFLEFFSRQDNEPLELFPRNDDVAILPFPDNIAVIFVERKFLFPFSRHFPDLLNFFNFLRKKRLGHL